MKKIGISIITIISLLCLAISSSIATEIASENNQVNDNDIQIEQENNEEELQNDTVLPEETDRSGDINKVSHRHMAIACAMAFVQPQVGQKLSTLWKNYSKVTKIVNDVNSHINLNEYAEVEELDDWVVSDQLGGITGGFFSEQGTSGYALERTNDDGSKDVILLFRATDTEVLGDIVWGIKNEHKQEDNAIKYTRKIAQKYSDEAAEKNINIRLHIAGHSLGGYLAQITGATTKQDIDLKNYDEKFELTEVVSFNGIGINFLTYFGDKYNYGNKQEIIATLKELNKENKLFEYYTYGDWVSALGVHYGEMRQLYPSIDSVSYQRDNFKALLHIGDNLINKLSEKNIFNMFKTDIQGASDFYGAKNLGAYFLLTHESDTFATLDLKEAQAKGINPSLKIIQYKTAVSIYTQKDLQEKEIETSKNITLKALTAHAAARKYVWERSMDDGNTWELLKSIDIRNTEGEPITNNLDIDINTIEEGQSVKYKVTSYYDDGYKSYRVTKNDKDDYVYEEDIEKQTIADQNKTEGMVEGIVTVTRKNSNALNKIEDGSSVKSIFARIKEIIINFINKIIKILKGGILTHN